MISPPPHEDVVTEESGDLTERRVAAFSRDRFYRYALSICWEPGLPVLIALMLNPSTADHMKNDPTVTRVCERARRQGFGGVLVLNAFAWRETDRLKMLQVEDPVGPLNDIFILAGLEFARAGGKVLVGWGNEGGHRGRSDEISRLLEASGVQAYCLKVCANGQPGHPLYVGYDAPMIPWPVSKAG